MAQKIIKKFSSAYNKSIEVVDENDNLSVLVDGFIQSGTQMEKIWDESIANLLPETQIKNVLILGFGTGSVVSSIRKRFPHALISAVEIDPIMIEIAQKYFPDNTKRIAITCSDAFTYIERKDKKQIYDLIVLDCYIGGKEPENTKTLKFLANLKLIGKNIIFNQLFLPKNKDELKRIDYLKKLDKLYKVKILKLPYNIIVGF